MTMYEVGLEMAYEGEWDQRFFLHEKAADAYLVEITARNKEEYYSGWEPYKREVPLHDGETL